MAAYAKLCLDCAAICALCVTLLARSSGWSDQVCRLCAEICEACATECERFDAEACRRCAKACRRCAEACRDMAA